MNRNNSPWQPAPPAELEWAEGETPRSPQFEDIYYSRENGLAESRQVFLLGNSLEQRWQERTDGRFVIAETGFGTGLNFLLTWQAWREQASPRPRLHYLAIEKYPLAAADLARALGAWPELAELAAELLANYPGRLAGQHRLVLEQGQLTLDLWWEDVAAALADLAGHGETWVDAWYLDGFAPARNPEMWQPAHFQTMARVSRPGASFATFTAAGAVRRGLEAAGFRVGKVPGYGHKRENLRGDLSAQSPGSFTTSAPALTPWDLPESRPARPTSAIVLGAGLAGCHVAAALARRGLQVCLLDQAEMAGSGSGNAQGVLYTRLSRRHSQLGDFALQSFGFASRHYSAMFASGQLRPGLDGELCGSFQQTGDSAEMAALATALDAVPELARILDPAAASELLGIEQPSSGYWFPRSGWLHPGAVCRALLAQAGILLREHCGPLALTPGRDGWRAGNSQSVLAEADIAVVATGNGSGGLAQLAWLPLQSIRGQTSNLPTDPVLQALRGVLCHEGYVAPARQGLHCIGASFNLDEEDTGLKVSDHQGNLAALARAVPAWSTALNRVSAASLDGRVGFRCASPDYLPLAGPVPDLSGFMQVFASLRKNARQTLAQRGPYHAGLYLSSGHGSRGLTSTPLAAELLASQIMQEPPPLCRDLVRSLAPARFLIRDLGRNRL